MDIYTLNGLNGSSDIIDTYESVIWNVQYFGQSEFQLVVAATQESVEKLKPKTYLVRDIDMKAGEYDNVMIIEGVKIHFESEKGWILTASGRGLKSIVGQRVIWNQTNLTGLAEEGIRGIITENIIEPSEASRKIDNFILDDLQGFEDEIEMQCFGENIAEWLEEVCKTYGFGWDVYIKNGKYVFKLYRGTDRTINQSDVPPVVFSGEYDNLLSYTYTYNITDYKNSALVGGEGEGTAQRKAEVGTAEGLERYEAYVDGSSVSSNGEIITLETYIKMLQEYGQTQLNQTAYTENFEGEIEPDGMYKINTDFFLGDLVQVFSKLGISAETRIIEIIYAEDQNGISVVPTFSEWEVDN